MVFCLTIIPTIILLSYIYKLDKKEKEPMKLLIKLFLFGVLSVIFIVIAEEIIDIPISVVTTEGSVMYALLEAFLVAALCEEVGKYLAVRFAVWKTPHFNCMYDGIVYTTFAALGFATLENILYVMDGGLATAITRMFTAIPGHASDAVFMGYYLSRAKRAEVNGDKIEYKKNIRKTLLVPMIVHGIYDFLLLMEEEIVGEMTVIFAVLIWYIFIAIIFKFTFKLVKRASKEDKFFAPLVEPDVN